MTGAASVDAEVAATLETLRPELARLARELYDEPEIGFAEHASDARLAALLTSHGAEVEVGVFGLPTALRTTFPAADGGRRPRRHPTSRHPTSRHPTRRHPPRTSRSSRSATRCPASATRAGTTSSPEWRWAPI